MAGVTVELGGVAVGVSACVAGSVSTGVACEGLGWICVGSSWAGARLHVAMSGKHSSNAIRLACARFRLRAMFTIVIDLL